MLTSCFSPGPGIDGVVTGGSSREDNYNRNDLIIYYSHFFSVLGHTLFLSSSSLFT